MDMLDIGEVEQYANWSAVAHLNPEQYSTLMACLVQWVDEHPGDTLTIATLKSIEFTREQ
jgi:hypothetical protein